MAITYCTIVWVPSHPGEDCETQQNVQDFARVLYLLIPYTIIIFFTSAICKINKVTKLINNKNLKPDNKVINLHIMCIGIMVIFISANIITGAIWAYAKDNSDE